MSQKYLLLDSAGIRKTGQRTMGAETFATYRTLEAARQADLICLVLDASQPLSHQDQVIAGIAKDNHKGLIVVANKADLLNEEDRREFKRHFSRKFSFLKIDYFLFISAKNATGLNDLWENIQETLNRHAFEPDPARVRKLFNYLMKQKPPQKLRIRKRAIVYDLKFIESNPPTFHLLVKDKQTLHPSYINFVENMLRQEFNLGSSGLVVKIKEIGKKYVLT